MTVNELIEKLQKYPRDYYVYAYDGEDTGVVVRDTTGKQVDMISCSEFDLTPEEEIA